MTTNYGLVLTGGGARAAFQAGVLKGVTEILGSRSVPADQENQFSREFLPFSVIAGISAGAINAAFLASHAANFSEATAHLCDLWNNLQIDQVLDTNLSALSRIGMHWMRDLSLGGILGSSRANHLLETTPLKHFLAGKINFKEIQNNINSKVLKGVALSVTNYRTGTAISFFDGDPSIQPWLRSSRIGLRSTLLLEHVLASASIPVLFAPVQIGHSFYGDGGIRMTSPLSPAIHLGAEKILAIGIRYSRSDEYTLEINRTQSMAKVTLADISGVMLNAAFLDTLESDIERMERINQTLSMMPEEIRKSHPQRLRPIPVLTIRPSQDLGTLASEQFHLFPRMLRYMLKGIGASDQQGWDLLSYLAFDKHYTGCLMELGYRDALAMKEEILEFFSE
ncbi:MAG: patatin-like phospholipase family protein [Bdellovibrionia bacterium]